MHENPRLVFLETLISTALRIDARIYERILERKTTVKTPARSIITTKSTTSQAPTPIMPQYASSSPRPTTHDTTTPMELDHQRNPLTPEEKQRRVEFRKLHDLCL